MAIGSAPVPVQVAPLPIARFCHCFRTELLEEEDGRPQALGIFEEEPNPCGLEAPKVLGYKCFASTHEQPLRGVPIREELLWFISPSGSCSKVGFGLYVNGFSFSLDSSEFTIALSPFSLVRYCRLDKDALADQPAGLKLFKISLFAQKAGFCYFFAVDGKDPDEERSKWVLDISHAIRLVTQSLFPAGARLTCDNVNSNAATTQRLLASYLVYNDDERTLSVLYAQLLISTETSAARFVAYESSDCVAIAFEIPIHEETYCTEKVGINCSCFSVNEHLFAARTVAERKIWLRALSNLKVRTANQAPTPTAEELREFREQVREQISVVDSTAGHSRCDPLLQPKIRGSFQAVGNGDTEPLPLRTPDMLLLREDAISPPEQEHLT